MSDVSPTVRNFCSLGNLVAGVVELATFLHTLDGPGEVDNWDNEEAVRVIRNTSQSIIPSQESSHEREETSGLDDWWIGCAHRITVEIANAEKHEGQVEREEQGEEGDG